MDNIAPKEEYQIINTKISSLKKKIVRHALIEHVQQLTLQ